MNKLVIPPPPTWYESQALACAPDNTVIYTSRQDVVIINPKPSNEPADIHTILRCHQDRIVAVVLGPKWGDPDKLVATIGDDKVVNLLDITKREIKGAHSGHTTRQDKIVGVTFAGHDRIISVSEDGFIVIWRWINNKLNSLTDLLGSKSKVTCVSSCPHATWLTAFGLKRGEILITDLRKTGRIVHRLRGHDTSIISLSWCPTPYNVFPEKKIIRFLRKSEKANEDKACDDETESLSQDAPESSKVVEVDEKGTGDGSTADEAWENRITLPEEFPTDCLSPSLGRIKDNAPTNEVSANEFENPICSDIAQIPDELIIGFSQIFPKACDSKPHSIFETAKKRTCSDKVCDISTKVEATNTEESGPDGDVVPIPPQIVSPSNLDNKIENSITPSDVKPEEEVENDSSKPETNNYIASSKIVDTNQTSSEKLEELQNNENESTSLNAENSLSVENQELIEVQNEPEMKEPLKEYLLASSSRGGRIINIWRAGTDGVIQTELLLSATKSRGNQRNQADEKSWVTLCWVTPKNLLSSSTKGELLQWKLAADGKCKPRMIHRDHYKHIFGIAAPIRLHESPEDEDWREKNLLNAWTIGRDRFIRNTSLCSKREALAAYQTFGGSIYCLIPSCDFPSKIAIGAAEGCRLWDLSIPQFQYIVMTNFSEKTQQKITSLAWHPKKDTILAYGSTEGRVGFLDPCNTSKPTVFGVQYANSAVHRLGWGPSHANPDDFLLYVVINGQLIAYDYNNRLQGPIVFEIEEYVTQMAWKPDHNICAVAAKGGHVLLYSSEMKHLTTLYLQNKSVRWITWHPVATAEDDDVSPYRNWVAVATNDVTVYDCVINDDLNSDYSARIVAVFKDHSKFVNCLSWSTFEGGKLASAGDDGMAMVWDVKSKTLLHTCVYTNDVLISVLWSPMNQDYIITGGKSGVLKIWNLSENAPQSKHARRRAPKVLELKEEEAEPEAVEQSDEEPEGVKEMEKPNRWHRRYVLAGIIEAQNRGIPSAILEDCNRLFTMTYGQSPNISLPEPETPSKQFDPLKIFGSDSDLHQLLKLERTGAAKKKIIRAPSHIHIWEGNAAKLIRDAINTKSLNPWVISMAPTVSHDLYLEACESYADNLLEDNAGNVYEAVSYYLACHKVEKAIELLCSTNNYLEALVLAKCRLISTDPLITKVLERWAIQSERTGAFELAAQCFMVLNQPDKAGKVLFKRADLESIKLCVELAKLGDDKTFCDAMLAMREMEEEEEMEPTVPLLSRAELELQMKKLQENNAEEGSSEEIIIRKDLDLETCTKVLGDGQGTNEALCPDELKTENKNEI